MEIKLQSSSCDLPPSGTPSEHSLGAAALRILVVEDNPTNQKVLIRQLESLGYEADVVTNGQAAIDAAAQASYRLILMDCCLPGVDGFTATRTIRQHEQQLASSKSASSKSVSPETVIIALTANNDPHVQADAIAAGMNDFLTKPLCRHRLAQVLQRWLIEQAEAAPCVLTSTISTANYDSIEMIASEAGSHWSLYFDLNQLHLLSDNNPEFEQELIQLYLEDTQTQLQRLHHATHTLDLRLIERIAHHLKGSSASVGANRLEQIAEQLEYQTKLHQVEEAMHLVAQFDQIFQKVCRLFQQSFSQASLPRKN